MELPEEMSRLISLQELVLDGCSNLESLNMELVHHQWRSLLQSDGIVASTSYITSLPLKLFFPSRFSVRKMLRFTSFSLPRSLRRLDLSGTTMRSLPESIKDLGIYTQRPIFKKLQNASGTPRSSIPFVVVRCVLLLFTAKSFKSKPLE
jgi:hypothetical protein